MAPTRGFCSRAGEMGMRHWRGAKWPLGDCTRDEKGSLAGCSSATPGDVGRCCASQCEACARCQYYSFAKDRRGRRGRRRNFTACRWYADTQCDMRDLRHSAGIHSKGEWQTVQAKRSVPAALPPDLSRASPLRLAIVGLTFGSSQHCGIVGWCQGARRLRRALPVQWTVTIAVIGGKDPRSARRRGHACEGATLLTPPRPRRLFRASACVPRGDSLVGARRGAKGVGREVMEYADDARAAAELELELSLADRPCTE